MIWNYVIIVILLCLSGLFSGLNLGLMGLNTFTLRRKAKLGNKYAEKLYPLRKKGNLLLCTILLGNVAVNSTLAVFLTSVTIGIIAGIVSTGLIVVFGEIVPQAFFSRYALRLCARTTWLVYAFMVILYPVAKPMAWTLDKVLGKELPSKLSKRELSLLLDEQKENLGKDEVRFVKSSLDFSDKNVKEVMTSKRKVFFLDSEQLLVPDLLSKVDKEGHSRIPVYDRKNGSVMGILYAKDLIGVDSTDKPMIKDLVRDKVHYVKETDKLDMVLNLFKQTKTHLFIVRGSGARITGIITLEDVLEEIVGEIVDEYDE